MNETSAPTVATQKKPKKKRPEGAGRMTDGEKALGRMRRILEVCDTEEARAALGYHVNRYLGSVTWQPYED